LTADQGIKTTSSTPRKWVKLVTNDWYPKTAVTTPAPITHTKGISRTVTDSAE